LHRLSTASPPCRTSTATCFALEAVLSDIASEGLPAYTDESPHPHAMEAGSPHARYAIVTRSGDSWQVEQRSVVYDWKAAADMAERNGRRNWAVWLRTGRA